MRLRTPARVGALGLAALVAAAVVSPPAAAVLSPSAAVAVRAEPTALPVALPASSGVSTGTYRVPSSGRSVSYLVMRQPPLTFKFVPGTEMPGGYSSRLDGPSTYRSRMVAAFNGGFLLGASGGYALRGTVYAGMRDGYASLVIRKGTGRLDVVKWSPRMRVSDYTVVRQNLTPLVYGGKNKTSTRGNGCDSWGAVGTQYRHCPGERSAVGVTSDGTVVYVYGYRVFADDLAQSLIHLGVVRGMVMEMNQAWPRAYTYSGGSARILDPSMNPVPGDYRSGYKRDFIVALG